MSLIKLVFPVCGWGELNHILTYLTLHEIYILGCCNRSSFITFMREKAIRSRYKTAQLRFISKLSDHDKILLVSYPRSGNSFLRKILEKGTGIVTGSDSRPNRPLSNSLLKFGYIGEGITDNSIWVVKSHYPERLGYIRFYVKKCILLVRNPFDAFESYFHMGMTNTHDKRLTNEVSQLYYFISFLNIKAFSSLESTWIEFLLNESKIWRQFHEYWLNLTKHNNIIVIRYEDIIRDEKVI